LFQVRVTNKEQDYTLGLLERVERAMDLACFKKLFEYDYWANGRLLTSLAATSSPAEEAIQKMGHILSAKEVWIGRLLDTPFNDLNQVFSAAEGRKLNEGQWARMNAYFSQLDESQLSKKVAYKNLKGLPFETVLSDILAHMVNHGSYHRGQIASLIKKSGGNPEGTDYIGFVREEDARR
jgi:uncharacterized damage-inducible protein DinB